MGTIALAEAVLHAGHCRFVLASSAEIYGLSFRAPVQLDDTARPAPTSPCAASQAAYDFVIGELVLHGPYAVRFRASNHMDAGQSQLLVVASFARQIARTEVGQQASVMQVSALARWRDFLNVQDVCTAYEAVLSKEIVSGARYNIASGTTRRVRTILNALIARSSVTPLSPLKRIACSRRIPNALRAILTRPGAMTCAGRRPSPGVRRWMPCCDWRIRIKEASPS
jgi:GDP-4-dehydro-6-deoxy-D-mannose reductase